MFQVIVQHMTHGLDWIAFVQWHHTSFIWHMGVHVSAVNFWHVAHTAMSSKGQHPINAICDYYFVKATSVYGTISLSIERVLWPLHLNSLRMGTPLIWFTGLSARGINSLRRHSERDKFRFGRVPRGLYGVSAECIVLQLRKPASVIKPAILVSQTPSFVVKVDIESAKY